MAGQSFPLVEVRGSAHEMGRQHGEQAAELIGISVFIILGAQTTGGSLGSMLAPAKIIVGCSTAGLAGREGDVLKKTLLPGLLIAACVGVVAWLAIWRVA